MATTYSVILRQVMRDVGALRGVTPEGIETSYTTNPIDKFQQGLEAPINYTRMIDAVLNAEATLAEAIASTAGHEWRQIIGDVTSALTYGAVIPSTGSGGSQVIGMRGAVRDNATSEPCTENQLERIRDRVQNPNTMWLIPVYWYAINDRRIYHTVTSVIVDVCTYTRPSALTLSLSTNLTLPEVLAPAYVDGALMEFDDKKGNIFEGWVKAIKSGNTSIDTATTVMQSKQEAA
jgi:hypothetical protein